MSIKNIFNNILKTILFILKNLEEIVGATLFIIMFAILVAQIIFRQIFDSPLIWSEELAILLFVYIGMLGVSAGVKYKQHVFIDFLYNRFKGKTLKIVNTFVQSVVFISILSMVYIGYRLFLRKKMFHLIALKISAGWMYGALPIISTLMLIRFIQVTIEDYKNGKFIIAPKKQTKQNEVIDKIC